MYLACLHGPSSPAHTALHARMHTDLLTYMTIYMSVRKGTTGLILTKIQI